MAAKHGGRLDQLSLEKALEDALGPTPGKTPPAEDTTIIHGKEAVANGGVDPAFAAKLGAALASSDRAEATTNTDDPSGLRAPSCTKVLTKEELANLNDEDDEDAVEKAPKLDHSSHGAIDMIDSKLVTDLSKRLIEEAKAPDDRRKEPTGSNGGDPFAGSLESALLKLGASETCAACGSVFMPDAVFCRKCGTKRPEADQAGDVFTKNLSAALEQTLGGDDLAASFDQRFEKGPAEKEDEADDVESMRPGLRAPQPTVKLSAEALAAIGNDDEDDEVVDSALLVAQSHGAITSSAVDKDLVAALNKQLGGQDVPSSKPPADLDTGFLSSLMSKLEAKETQDDDIDVMEVGCQAPAQTMKLSQDMLAELSDGEDEIETKPNLSLPAPAAASSKAAPRMSLKGSPRFADAEEDRPEEAEGSGLRAPEPTTLITADMLADLADEDDEEDKVQGGKLNLSIGPDLPQPSSERPDKPKKGVGFSGGSSNFEPAFAENLNKKLQGGLQVSDEPPEVFDDEDETQTSGVYGKGLTAPPGTVQLSQDQLKMLDDDDDDIPIREAPKGMSAPGPEDKDKDWRDEERTGMQAPHATVMVGADMLVGIDDDDDEPVEVNCGPSAAQLATLSAAALALHDIPPVSAQQQGSEALTMDSVSATKVSQLARGLQEGTDLWGKQKAPTSSCKLRLAWLSKDEVRKENDQLRKEIQSLRAEIDMHRKEATLARKA